MWELTWLGIATFQWPLHKWTHPTGMGLSWRLLSEPPATVVGTCYLLAQLPSSDALLSHRLHPMLVPPPPFLGFQKSKGRKLPTIWLHLLSKGGIPRSPPVSALLKVWSEGEGIISFLRWFFAYSLWLLFILEWRTLTTVSEASCNHGPHSTIHDGDQKVF